MAAKGDAIHCLDDKVQIAAKTLSARGTIDRPSLSALANALGVAGSSLSEATADGRMTKNLATKFAELCGFQQTDPRWIDPGVPESHRRVFADPNEKYRGRDTSEGFAELLAESFLGDRARLDTFGFEFHDSNLLDFELDDAGQETALDVPFQLFLRVSANLGRPAEAVAFGFRQIRISVLPETDERTRFSNHLGGRAPVELRDAVLTATRASKRPQWTLRAKAKTLVGEYVTEDAPLCTLADMGRLDTLRVEISVNVHDPDYLFVEAAGDVSAQKRSIIEALLRSSIRGATESEFGWKVLGLHRLRMKVDKNVKAL